MRRWLPITLAVSLSAGILVHAADDLVTSRFSDYIEALRVQAGIPGMVATIVGPNDIQWEKPFGLADIDRNIGVRTDTPFHVDGLTQMLSATLALRCVSDGWFTLNQQVDGGTLGEVLSHTSQGPNGPVFSYRLDRLDAVAAPIAACAKTTFAGAVGNLLSQNAMSDAVPGADAVDAGWADGGTRARYAGALGRLATPYAVDSRGRASASSYGARTLTPGGGLIASAHDLAQFDLGIKRGFVLRPDFLVTAWTPQTDASGQRLPHGIGWFVQNYNGERLVWQFGVGDNASSSLVVTVPGRGLTLILLANSQGLTRPYPLAQGDVTVSPFARIFLSLFVR
jgi:CubicO group peptidase (beta-lactamase class C family)